MGGPGRLAALARTALDRQHEFEGSVFPYCVRSILLETFVEAERFPGTCYAAANWQRVGRTQGRGRMDRAHRGGQPVKDIWLLPLRPDFRHRLTGGRLPREPHTASRVVHLP